MVGAFQKGKLEHTTVQWSIYLHGKTPWFKYRICIRNAAERTYFKWSNIATILKTPVASDAIFYAFLHKLYHYDDASWIMGKHTDRITVDFDMDVEEDIKILKANIKARKHFLIESDLGYTPTFDIRRLDEAKKKKLLM